MKQILDFIPLLLFFILYKLYGMQVGVSALMIASTIVILLHWLLYKQLTQMAIFTYVMVMLFGALTLYLNDLLFLKWKVTIIYAIFSAILIGYQLLYKQPLLKKLFGKEIQLNDLHWQRLTYSWIALFILCGLANLVITYYCSDDTWTIYKAFILPGVTVIASIISAIYIYKQSQPNQANKQP